MPWHTELFSARFVAEQTRKARVDRLSAVPFFAGLLSGEADALIDSFAGEPEVHHPIQGRVKGAQAFSRFVSTTSDQLDGARVEVENVDLIITPDRTVEEVVLSFDEADRRVDLPVAVVTELGNEGIVEVRMYFSTWPITGKHTHRPPLLQRDPDAREEGSVGDYQRALARGDVDSAVSAFEPDAYVREPAGSDYIHRGEKELRDLYTLFFSNGGGIPLEHCAVTDDGRACAVEYNVVHWGRTPLRPEAGVAVYVRGSSGKLVAARIYDDTDPPVRG